MSKLKELIDAYCPSGVSFNKLEKVVKGINIGINPRKFFSLNPQDACGFYVTVRELNGLNGVTKYNKTDLINSEALKIIQNRADIEQGTILFSNTGTVGKLALIQEFHNDWGVNEGIYVIKPNLDMIVPKFLYYYLDSNICKKAYNQKLTGSTLKHITQESLLSLDIPTPALEIQYAIVHILDNFTELTARKKQYEYYRDKLLTLDYSIPMVALKDIATSMYRGSGIKKDQVTDEGIPCVRYGEIYTIYNTSFQQCITHTKPEFVQSPKYFEYGDVLFAITGENVEDIAKSIAYLGNEKCLAGGDIVVMKHSQNPRYLAHILNTAMAKEQKSKGKVKSKVVHSNIPSLEQIKIPLPSLDIQERFANILDNFEAICNDLNIGLPAEIDARQKQYEFYRDQLLTFVQTGNSILTDRQTDRQTDRI